MSRRAIEQKKRLWLEQHVFVDVETGSLDRQRCAVLEVALVSGDGRRCLSLLVQPAQCTELLDEALAVNHIDLDEVERFGVDEAAVVEAVTDFFEREQEMQPVLADGSRRRSVRVAGSNICFDVEVMRALYEREGAELPRAFERSLDTASFARGVAAAGGMEWPDRAGLDALVSYFGTAVTGARHRALPDARAARDVVEAMLSPERLTVAALLEPDIEGEVEPAPSFEGVEIAEVPDWLKPSATADDTGLGRWQGDE